MEKPVVPSIGEIGKGVELLPEVWREGMLAAREIPGQGICCIQRFMLTCGVLTKVEFSGFCYFYEARYCYPSMMDAWHALWTWDGQGDPPEGWVKEKVSERGPKETKHE